jgi:hypothetical protein
MARQGAGRDDPTSPRIAGGGSSRPSETVSREDPIGQLRQTAETGPSSRRQQPAQADGRVGTPKDLHTLDDGSVRKHAVDSSHHHSSVEPVSTGLEGRLGNVFEQDAPAPSIPFLEEPDLA